MDLKTYLMKIMFFILVASMCLCGTSICFDPAHLFSDTLITEMTEELNKGNIISAGNANIDERMFQKLRISSLNNDVDTVIIGSSRVMYLPISDENWYNAGVSAATLNDYYGLIGIMEADDMQINKLIIGIDPWIFNAKTDGVEYKSIIPYINYEEKLCNNDMSAFEELDKWNWEYDCERLKTAYSPSYFKRALAASRRDFRVTIEENTDVSSVAKIMPNGQRIPEETFIHTIEKNEKDATNAINRGSLYYIQNFRELDVNLVKSFENLIRHLRDRGIIIEFFLPAWYPMHYDEIVSNPDYKGVLLSEEYLLEFAKENHITVRGSFNPYICDLKNVDFMDTLHLRPEKVLDEFSYIPLGG